MHLVGDKVRVKATGERGVIDAVGPDWVSVLADHLPARLGFDAITNYSDAARRAWIDRPKKAGRPRLPAPRKRMVSLRLDLEVLDLISRLAEHGLIASREQAINDWCRQAAIAALADAATGKGRA
jgi:uncharacterized protein (DUF4415 family)